MTDTVSYAQKDRHGQPKPDGSDGAVHGAWGGGRSMGVRNTRVVCRRWQTVMRIVEGHAHVLVGVTAVTGELGKSCGDEAAGNDRNDADGAELVGSLTSFGLPRPKIRTAYDVRVRAYDGLSDWSEEARVDVS